MTTQFSLPENQFADALGLVHALKVQASRENKRKNLDLIWQVLERMWLEGSRDFSVAEVGRKLTEAGGPKTQSLRNEGGQDFRRVIEAFAACAGARVRAPLAHGKTQLDIAVEVLPDPAARAMFRQAVAENKLYKAQNDQLRSAFKELSVKRPSEVLTTAQASLQGVNEFAPQLTVREKELLKRNLSPERFEENGWTRSEGGGVIDDAGVVVLSPGFMEVIERLLA